MLTPAKDKTPREPRPQSPGLMLRVALLGALTVCLFAVLFFRLWVVQVLSADKYRALAAQSQLRTVRVQAPRGQILAADGAVLVENRAGDAITFDLTSDPLVAGRCARSGPVVATRTPPTRSQLRRMLRGLKGRARRRRLAQIMAAYTPAPPPWRGCAATNASLTRMAAIAGVPISQIEDAIHQGISRAPFEPVTLLGDVDATPSGRDLVWYLEERAMEFRGIKVSKRSIRAYPVRVNGFPIASQIYGEIGELTAADETQPSVYPGAQPNDIVGHSGIELTYDRWLRGTDGTLNITVDAQGTPQGVATMQPAPAPGDNVRLTIQTSIQKAAENAIADGIQIARSGAGTTTAMPRADYGAMVVMDVHTGAVLAMASNPPFDPNRLIGAGSDAYIKQLFSGPNAAERAPVVNRAIAGYYPPGSTFKPVTALAAMETSLATPDEQIMCDGRYLVDGHWYKNFEAITNTTLDLRQALTQSCDTYFYRLGKRLYDATSKDGRYQPQAQWMRRLGFGHATGIDIPYEASGVAPDAQLKARLFKNDAIDNRWTSGDAVNAAIGQGLVQVTPLQMASLYALIANGGTLVTPHVGLQVETPQGAVVKRFLFPARGHLALDPYILATIRQGLWGVTHDQGGTASGSWAGFPVSVAGKTGTAQKAGKDDYSWFVGYAPADNPEIVAACVIEQGGFGGIAAARAVRDVFKAAFRVGTRTDGTLQAFDLNGTPLTPDATQVANGQVWGDPTLGAGPQTTTTPSQTTTTPTTSTPTTTQTTTSGG